LKDLIANFYELWGGGYLGGFSDQMFNNDLYFPVALYSIIVALAITIIYYYILDRPNTANMKVWMLALLIGAIINAVVAFVSANNDLVEIFASIGEEVPNSFSYDMLMFAFINAIWTLILMFVLSIILKWKSPNSSYIPF
jgi:ABC-type enterochelin transport system permease subunit